MGRGDYDVTGGSVTIDGEELLGLPTWQRAQRGLFLAMQYPVEVPGVPLEHLVGASLDARGVDARRSARRGRRRGTRARRARPSCSTRGVNDEFSGGEKKRAETVQLAVLEPKFAVLDEIDSGLDVDALRDVARRVDAHDAGDGPRRARDHALRARCSPSCGPTACTCSSPAASCTSGGPELADELERTGYEGDRGRARHRRARRRAAGRSPTRSATPPSDSPPTPSKNPGPRSPTMPAKPGDARARSP